MIWEGAERWRKMRIQEREITRQKRVERVVISHVGLVARRWSRSVSVFDFSLSLTRLCDSKPPQSDLPVTTERLTL